MGNKSIIMSIGISAIVAISGCGREYNNSSYSRSDGPPSSSTQSDRDRRIDQYVDSNIDTAWRPRPGGNSKEDAAWVTKDILKAKTWEELEATIQFHSSQGR